MFTLPQNAMRIMLVFTHRLGFNISKSQHPKEVKSPVKKKIVLILPFLIMLLFASTWAADIMGKWIAKIPAGKGTVETVFNFKWDGSRLTGTVADPQGETAISMGLLIDDEISFAIDVRSPTGNKTRLVYKGKIAGDDIKFTRTLQDGTGQPLEFVARREFSRNGDIPLAPRERK
jgi:hypothetical protein